jgi:catechol 2,3-dioxygenase-like lactoylglutathione lyase family enzyme
MKLRLAVIELVVSDMAASLAFYRRLGIDIPPEADTEPHVHIEVGGMHLAFDTEDTIRSFDPGWSRPSGPGHSVALAFAGESPAEVDKAWEDLIGAGYEGHLAPWDAFWGMRYAVVRDPDGTTVDILAPCPGPNPRAALVGTRRPARRFRGRGGPERRSRSLLPRPPVAGPYGRLGARPAVE